MYFPDSVLTLETEAGNVDAVLTLHCLEPYCSRCPKSFFASRASVECASHCTRPLLTLSNRFLFARRRNKDAAWDESNQTAPAVDSEPRSTGSRFYPV